MWGEIKVHSWSQKRNVNISHWQRLNSHNAQRWWAGRRESPPGLLLAAHAGLAFREPSLAMWTQTTEPVILLLGLCLQDNHRKHTRTVSAILLMFKPWQRPKCPGRLNYGRIRWRNEVCENWLGHVTLIQMWEQKQETAEPAGSSFQILSQLDLWRHIVA